MLLASVSGCLSAKVPNVNDEGDRVRDRVVPVLRMVIEIADQKYEYATEEAAGAAANRSNSVSATATKAADNGGQYANSTANETGNAATNETDAERANETLQNRHPYGYAPLDARYTLIVERAVGVLNWTFTTGDEAPATAGAAAGSGSENATDAGNSTSSQANGTAGNASDSANGKAVRAGSTANATFNHTYTTVGNYTPTFTLNMANGAKLELKANVLVAAAEVAKGEVEASATTAVAPGTPLGTLLLDQTGTFTASAQNLSGSCAGTTFASLQVGSFPWEFPVTDSNGTNAVVSHVKIVLTAGTTAPDIALAFYAPDGKLIKGQDAAPATANTETLEADGPFVAGTYSVKAYGCVAVNASYKVHGEAALVAL